MTNIVVLRIKSMKFSELPNLVPLNRALSDKNMARSDSKTTKSKDRLGDNRDSLDSVQSKKM